MTLPHYWRENTVIVAIGEREASHYVQLIERAQWKLQVEGFYSSAISDEYSSETMEAMAGFQESIGFDATAFPDQLTLRRLLRMSRTRSRNGR